MWRQSVAFDQLDQVCNVEDKQNRFVTQIHLPKKCLQPASPPIGLTPFPFSLPVAPVLQRWSLSLVHPRHPPYELQTVPLSMIHLVSGISFQLLSDNLESNSDSSLPTYAPPK